MRTGEHSGTECGCQAEVWVSVLVCAFCLPVHFHRCVPTLVCTCSYICVCVMSCLWMCIYFSIYVFPHKHIQNGLYMGSLLGWMCHPVLRPPISTPRAPDCVASI